MKKLLLLGLLSLFVFQSCVTPEEQAQEQKNHTKKIIAKKEEVGSHYNLFTKKQVIETEHILIAEDGSTLKVELGEFYKIKVGDSYYSYMWDN